MTPTGRRLILGGVLLGLLLIFGGVLLGIFRSGPADTLAPPPPEPHHNEEELEPIPPEFFDELPGPESLPHDDDGVRKEDSLPPGAGSL